MEPVVGIYPRRAEAEQAARRIHALRPRERVELLLPGETAMEESLPTEGAEQPGVGQALGVSWRGHGRVGRLRSRCRDGEPPDPRGRGGDRDRPRGGRRARDARSRGRRRGRQRPRGAVAHGRAARRDPPLRGRSVARQGSAVCDGARSRTRSGQPGAARCVRRREPRRARQDWWSASGIRMAEPAATSTSGGSAAETAPIGAGFLAALQPDMEGKGIRRRASRVLHRRLRRRRALLSFLTGASCAEARSAATRSDRVRATGSGIAGSSRDRPAGRCGRLQGAQPPPVRGPSWSSAAITRFRLSGLTKCSAKPSARLRSRSSSMP